MQKRPNEKRVNVPAVHRIHPHDHRHLQGQAASTAALAGRHGFWGSVRPQVADGTCRWDLGYAPVTWSKED